MAVTRIKNNQITDSTVNAAAKLQDYSITSGKIANNLTYGSSLIIAGNLTVQGNVTTIETTDLVIEDPLILLAKDQTGTPTLDIGFIGKRGNEENIAWVWDESADQFATVFTSSEVTNTVVTISSYASMRTQDLTASNVTVTGNITSNILTANSFVVSGNISANNLAIGNAITAKTLNTTGNVYIGGNLTVDGNVTYININDLRIEDPIIVLGTGPNGAPLTTNDNLDRGIFMEYYTTGRGNSFVGWQNTSGNMIIANNVKFSGNDVVQVDSYGTLNVGNIFPQSANVAGTTSTRFLTVDGQSGQNFTVNGATNNILTVNPVTSTVQVGTGNTTTGATFVIAAADSMLLPVGNNAQRPGAPQTGMFRFNTTIDAIEYYTSASWESVSANFTVIQFDQFSGDGSTVAFTLTDSITTAAAIVCINGVVQLPFTSYTITGVTLTFTEAPVSTDVIDVRLITTTSTVVGISNPNGSASISTDQNLPYLGIVGNLIPTPNNTYSLGNATNRWTEGWFANSSVIIGNVKLSEVNNTLSITNYSTNAAIAIANLSLQNGTSNIAIPTTNGNVLVYSGGNLAATFSTNGYITAPTDVVATANTVAAHNWAGSAKAWLAAKGEAVPNRLTLGVANISGPVQTAIVNQSNGALAYSEFIAINNVGNTEQGWISMGINSNEYNDPGFLLTGADDAYVLYEAPVGSAGSGNLVLATGSNGTDNAIVFGAGGFATGNTQMTIIPDQAVHIEIPTVSTSASTGALTVVGGVGVLGNVNVQGDVGIGGNLAVSLTSTITANNFQANEHIWSGLVQPWLTAEAESATGKRFVAVANTAGPAQNLQVNQSSDTLAYAEFIAINNLGNTAEGWISMGINSSTYNDPGFQLTGADDGYLLFDTNGASSSGPGNLVIATGNNGSRNAIVFGAGGFATGNVQMAIIPDSQVLISIPTRSTSTGTGALVVNGGVGLTGNLNVGGNVNIAGNITLGGSGNTIDVSALAVSDPLIYMGANNAADVLDLGFVGEYKKSSVATYAGLVRDASDGSFRFFANVVPKPTSTINFAAANLVYPSVAAGNLLLQSTTAATSTVTGALVVPGGAGIAGAVYIGGLINAVGNVIAGNVQSGAAITATTTINATGNVTGGNLVTGGNITATGALSVNSGGGTIAIVNAASNGVGNIGSSTSYFNTVFAKATSAQYADLAEMYETDNAYEPGTVMAFGGTREVTISLVSNDARVAGVVSTTPSYLMNSAQPGEFTAAIALQGRVPTQVTGPVRKGDMMVSAGDGRACACAAPQMGTVIGKALEDHSGGTGVIEVVVGRL